MSTSTDTNPFELAERRAARLTMVLEGYEVGEEGMPDSSVPGAARVEYAGAWSAAAPRVPRKHPRYVLLTQYGDKGNYRTYLANDVANVEQLARLAVCDGESIVVYFDLDELAGEEPEPDERMPVRYGLAKVAVSVVFNTVPSPA